ncbi:MAG TPA: YHS domain-containing (seleno)protein [Dehalococcoidia bacterium]|jgi:hypothetical protein|nr:YHS domain-containing (seleno)protein [Dehalococcoidia bacterium]
MLQETPDAALKLDAEPLADVRNLAQRSGVHVPHWLAPDQAEPAGGRRLPLRRGGPQGAFEAESEKYVPAYGGYCAYGLAVAGKRFPVAIDTWQIVDGRLMLNKNAGVREKFDADRADMVAKADANWQSLVERENE